MIVKSLSSQILDKHEKKETPRNDKYHADSVQLFIVSNKFNIPASNSVADR